MISLIIDTTNNFLQLELWKGKEKLDESYILTNNNVSEKMIPMVQRMLNENEIHIDNVEKIYLVIGPGSFTGVRIGMNLQKC